MGNQIKGCVFLTLFFFSVTTTGQTLNYCPAATDLGFFVETDGCSDNIQDDLVILYAGADKVIGSIVYFGYDTLDPSVDFGNACVDHDFCYATPSKSKSWCDRQFREKMRNDCDSKYKPEIVTVRDCNRAPGLFPKLLCHKIRREEINPLNTHCKNTAEAYYQFVKNMNIAKSSYDTAQENGITAQNICSEANQPFMSDYTSPGQSGGAQCTRIDIGMTCNDDWCSEAFSRTCYSHGGTSSREWRTMVCKSCP